jgi:ATP-dependent helicase/nuclease subunit A
MSNFSLPPIPEGQTWTTDQWKAINIKNKDILVAAAAGSGKTAVLVNRIIRKILSSDDPINVDELLVVTFTNASAAEMRHRIGEALEAAINEDPGNRHLRKQLGLLNKASISTLHSFCMEVIRKYYYLIDVDPGFRIADETEAQLIRDEVMDELFEAEYGKEDNEAFLQLVDTFTNDRSDDALTDIVRSIYDFAQANPDPEQYLNTILSMYEVSEEMAIEDLPYISALIFEIELQLEGVKELLQRGLFISMLPDGPAPLGKTFTDDLQVIDTLIQANKASWAAMYQAMQLMKFSTAARVTGNAYDTELKDKAKDLREKAKKRITVLKEELFSRNPDRFMHDLTAMRPVARTLVNLVRDFAVRYSAAKRERGLVDYADLEHDCIKILTLEIDSNGEFLPSEAAKDYQQQFNEVFVDEYQDTNMVQETILKLVAKNDEAQGNLFMVGDVKQSIYRFRLAEPNLFLGKYNRFDPEGSSGGIKIDLAQNFRSRREILDGTNYLFKQIMGVKVGEIEYDEAAELKKGAPYPEDELYPVELLLIDQEKGSRAQAEALEENELDSDVFDAVDLEKSQLEARVMAEKIKELISSGTQVYNPKHKDYRPLQYRDMVILLRSMPWAPQIIEEFKQQGIPIYANLSTGYFEATEVAVMMSLLHTIDNPYQDIPLASVLRSPIVGLNEEELAKIRTYNKKGTFWEAVTAFCRSASAASSEVFYEKVSHFNDNLKEWRELARLGSLAELIWQIYRDTRFYDFAGGLPGGKQRQANLRALYDRARQYEQTSFRGLFRFLRFIERMMERGDDLGAARALGEQEDVVRLMTIHSSKGLEFPVVFIAGLSKTFNKKDLQTTYALDKDYGFAAKYIDIEKRISYPSLPLVAFKRKKKMEMLAEEMRVLYVALTRAKEKLYLVASFKDLNKSLEQWNEAAEHNEWLLKDYMRASAVSYLDWIGPALIRHQDCSLLSSQDANQTGIAKEITAHPSNWKISVRTAHEIQTLSISQEKEEDSLLEMVAKSKTVNIESAYKDEIESRLNWEYSHLNAAKYRSKQSVSELKRQREIADDHSGTDLKQKFTKPILKRPKFMQEKTLSPAEKGTSMHLVMQHIDLSNEVTAASIQEQLTRMEMNELLTKEQAEVIDVDLIVQFFHGELGRRYFNSKKLQREIPFTLSLPANEVYPMWNGSKESIFVQGVIDCVFEDEKGLVLIDYKTDAISGRYKGGFDQAKPILEARYRLQIDLYTKAIETIWKRKVTERYLFFFDGAYLIKF